MATLGSLPRTHGSFVGRRRELTAIDTTLRAARWVTLVGPAGIGKTRLAIEWARGSAINPLFAELGGVPHLAGLCRELGDRLDLPLVGGSPEDHSARIARSLAARGRVTLICDDLDCLVDVARTHLDAWIAAAPELRVVATSRRRLDAAAERAIEVGSLAAADGFQLFVDRAGRAQPGWSPSAAESRDVATIVEQVDALPLAIELASARLAVASPAQIAELLSRQLDLLADPKHPNEKHRSLRLALQASWDLLDGAQHRVLERAGLFETPFTLDVAAVAVGPHGEPTQRRIEVLNVLQSLVDRSLVLVEVDADGVRRFRLLAAVAEFAREALGRGGGVAHAQRDRAEAVIERAESLVPLSRQTPAAFRALLHESREILSVIDVAISDRRADHAVRALAAFSRIASARGPSHAFVERAERIAPMLDDVTPMLRAEYWRSISSIALTVGEFRRGLDAAQRTFAIDRELGDRSRALWSRFRLAGVSAFLGDESRLDELLADDPSLEGIDPLVATIYLNVIGEHWLRREDYEQARAWLLRGLELARKHGLREKEGHLLGHLARCDLGARRLPEARAGFERASALLSEMYEARLSVAYRADVGLVLLEEGAIDAARDRLQSALEEHRRLDDSWHVAECAGHLACLELLAARFEDAVRHAGDAVRTHAGIGDVGRTACFEAVRAIALAELGRADLAEAALRACGPDLERFGRTKFFEICRAHLSVKRGSGLEEARSLADRELRSGQPEARLLARALSAAIQRARLEPQAEWVVAEDGAWVRHAERRIAIEGAAPRRVLATLARWRVASPGTMLDVDRLFAAGWPGETAEEDRRKNRVRVTLTRLRKAGLRDLLLGSGNGYLLDPSTPIRVE